jgi:tetratricopeptide (TPR) repeat protein
MSQFHGNYGNYGHYGNYGNYGRYGFAHYGGEWWHHGGNWGYFGRYGFWPYNWYPWFAFGWWPGYYGYYPYYFDNYGIPGYGYGDFVAGYETYPYTAAYTAPPAEAPVAAEENGPAQEGAGGTIGQQYLAGARDAFRQANYSDALRLAGHAAVETPRDVDVHNLLMMAMFAAGNYRGATMEAHAAASLGQPMHWDTLYAFYGDVKPYTEQLRALEKFVAANPSDPGARFLLGYQYLMMGHNDAAKTELTKSLLQAPKDRLAANLLVQVGGTVPDKVKAIQQEMEKDMPKAAIPPVPGNVAPVPAKP